MSFSSQTLSTKRQHFDDSENEEKKATEPQQSDMSKDEEINPDYISLPISFYQKGTNCLSNLGEGTKNLTHLVSI